LIPIPAAALLGLQGESHSWHVDAPPEHHIANASNRKTLERLDVGESPCGYLCV
jgi:hypothetical protein